MTFWDAVSTLSTGAAIGFAIALLVAFAFEFINGFHDTSNAVTTVIYTRSLPATPAVIYSGFLNFLGVLIGGTGVAFGIVNLLPVDLLIEGQGNAALVMVMALLIAGVIWNLGTWYVGLPVSSSHTLIGSILGVGLANGWYSGQTGGVRWDKAGEVLLALMVSPFFGFIAAGGLLLLMKFFIRVPRLYVPPEGDDQPPGWIRWLLITTCGGVSFAHGSNDGQKGMGLILLVLIGFLPAHYAVNIFEKDLAANVRQSAVNAGNVLDSYPDAFAPEVRKDLQKLATDLEGKSTFAEVPTEKRWEIRQTIYRFRKHLEIANITPEAKKDLQKQVKTFDTSIEFVPLWVVIGVALALGIGTTIGYKRIVVTVAEKIGKTHLTYAQGGAAELVAAATIFMAVLFHVPVSTTHVLSGGIAGTMVANRSGLQGSTAKKILLAWLLTLPASMTLAALLYVVGRTIMG